MLRTRLLTATAAIALFAAPAAFAQDASTGGMTPTPQTPATSSMPAQTPAPAPTPAPAEAPAEAVAPAATTPAEPATETAAATPAAGGNVIDTLKANGQFTTLLSALDAAQLTATLQSQPAISIFAPTDAAFASLPEAERTRLMDPANVNDLRQLLLYHVIVADVNSSQIQGAKGGVETAARSQVQLDGTGASLKVDDATIVQADIDASNGAVFAIDKVLNPAASQAAMGDEEAAPAVAATEAPVDTTTDATAPADEGMADEATTDEAPMTEDTVATPPTEATTTEVPAPTPPVEADADAEETETPAPTPAPQPQA